MPARIIYEYIAFITLAITSLVCGVVKLPIIASDTVVKFFSVVFVPFFLAHVDTFTFSSRLFAVRAIHIDDTFAILVDIAVFADRAALVSFAVIIFIVFTDCFILAFVVQLYIDFSAAASLLAFVGEIVVPFIIFANWHALIQVFIPVIS